jgi:hypothetical protein
VTGLRTESIRTTDAVRGARSVDLLPQFTILLHVRPAGRSQFVEIGSRRMAGLSALGRASAGASKLR